MATHPDITKLPYRPCVGQFIVNRDGRVWVGCRTGGKNLAEGGAKWWQMPQGGIDPGEDPEKAAVRELYEETGITSVVKIGETPRWLNYDLPPELLGMSWGGRYRGQTQKWFAFRFQGSDSEIAINPPPGGHEPEFTAWRWVEVGELLDLVVPFKRDVYKQIIAEFAPLAIPARSQP